MTMKVLHSFELMTRGNSEISTDENSHSTQLIYLNQ